MRVLVQLSAALVLSSQLASGVLGNDALGVRVPEGFEVTLYADDDLAHDIYSMTVDSQGRVVVSGAGYVRILIDEDQDGRADSFKQYASPRSGAQGMHFYGNDLLCTADNALLRYRDRNRDDQADGPPEEFLKLKAGGEHDTHAIHRGPDGWWYLIAGNYAGVNERYITTATSPVTEPRMGVLFRLTPDLAQGEIVAHGFRNAYDFDFTPFGELLTYDSDGEREISLPWYLPTRVFHVLPGTDAGWVSHGWKRPAHYSDMMPALAAFGRGSPTGVVSYRHTQFPEEYHGAAFVLDWTYGRIFALPLQPDGGTLTTKPIEFMTGDGEHGFAPTDAVVGPDGSLYVSVGGRGTRGGVYRIRAKDRPASNALVRTESKGLADKLNACLSTPDPLSSWGRALWEPLARDIPSDEFIRAALDERRAPTERIRAIEILTEKFQGLDGDMLAALARAGHPAVRARAAWSHGRTRTTDPIANRIEPYLKDGDPLVVRTALEALMGANPGMLSQLVEPLAGCLASPDRHVRRAAILVVSQADDDTYHAIAAEAAKTGWTAGISIATAYAYRHPGADPYSIDVALRVLKAQHPIELKRDAVRLIQLALGDMGPSPKGSATPRDPVFDGYASPLDLSSESELTSRLGNELLTLYPTGDEALDHELTRVLAMIQFENSSLLDKVLAPITADSHPVEDIHRLIASARLPGPRTDSQRTRIAEAFVRLDEKISTRELLQDSSWNDRILETYSVQSSFDPELPVAMLKHPQFGRSAHAQFLPLLDEEHFPEAIEVFVRTVKNNSDYQWTPEIVILLAMSEEPDAMDLIRAKFDDFGLRSMILSVLSESPQEKDRELFVAGLDSPQIDTLEECIVALQRLPPGTSPAENVALVRLLRRLDTQGAQRQVRDQVVEALRRNTRQQFDYVLGKDGDRQQEAIERWTAYIQQTFRDEFNRQTHSDAETEAELAALLQGVPWDHGDSTRGEVVFQKRACIQCHGSRTALGPDLKGAAGRFSREDLFTAIVLPHRDVSPRYQTTLIVTDAGKTFTGVIVYESVDGLVLRDANNRTWRIETRDIELRQTLTTSLMPTGLLKGLETTDIADLYAYLRSIGQVTADRGATEQQMNQ